jgi:serine/threonine protein kinase/tetratricopeptide (TPR) repeat protein
VYDGRTVAEVPLHPGVIVGKRYRLDRFLGAGGMGQVWSALNTATGRSVAIKSLRADLGGEHFRARFAQEARAASSVRHPNVVDVLDFVTEESEPCLLVMELLNGETLAAKLEREQQLALPEAAQLLLQVAHALSAAKEHAILHRDLKPANIFLCSGASGACLVKVLDFGIAKSSDPEQSQAWETQPGAVLGTACYMAPEQALAESTLDARADLWSLGAVCYESLSGARPIDGENIVQVQTRLLSSGIIPLGQLMPELPSDLTQLVDQLLARDRERRPHHDEIVRVLHRHAGAQTAVPNSAVVALAQRSALSQTLLQQPAIINQPPAIAPKWFQGRRDETQLVLDFLEEKALRILTVLGRGGVGKSALVCRVLRSFELAATIAELPARRLDAIVYVNAAHSLRGATLAELVAGLRQVVPEASAARVDKLLSRPGVGIRERMKLLLEAIPRGCSVVLLDSFEEALDVETGRVHDSELEEALRAVLELPHHGVKLIVTTRFAPEGLALIEPGRQRRIHLDAGLEHPFAENLLRALDADGKLGLRDAPDSDLALARERTRGYPRALEHLFGILCADRDASLSEILHQSQGLLPDNVLEVLVGQAFRGLDAAARQVMQVLAVYRYPVPTAAIDYVLLSATGASSAPVLRRLVNLQFARREANRYYAHQLDRDFALAQLPAGDAADRSVASVPFTRTGLRHRAAEWLKQEGRDATAWKRLEDIAPRLSEYELRCDGEDHDAATAVALELTPALLGWGQLQLVVELHERLQGSTRDAALAESSTGRLGVAYYRLARYPRAIACYEGALSQARERKNRAGEGAWLGNLASARAHTGSIASALELGEQALAIMREVGDRRGEAIDLGNLANRYIDLGRYLQAREALQQSLAISQEQGDQGMVALTLCNLGDALLGLGELDGAEAALARATLLAREAGNQLLLSAAGLYTGELCSDRGRLAEAAGHFEQALEIAEACGLRQVQMQACLGSAHAALLSGDALRARERAERAATHDLPLLNHRASALIGIAAWRQGEREAARSAFGAALEQATQLLGAAPECLAALDGRALVRCGLALCGELQQLEQATLDFRAARRLCSAPGVVGRVLRSFDVLVADHEGADWPSVRAAAAAPSP